MKPEGKEYEEPVLIPQVWEAIPHKYPWKKEDCYHYLIEKHVQDYIRYLEEQLNIDKK